MYSEILIRFGELSTKGKNKMTFVRKLAKNIKKLTGAEPRIEFDRIFLDYSEEVMQKLQYVFGIYSYSPVVKCDTDLEVIKKHILDQVSKVEGKTFKVVTKRHWKGFNMQSNDVNMQLGGLILENFKDLSVDVKNPDFKPEVEIREKFSYVFTERVLGLGGYPTGINGKVLHLISGGIDSPVAAIEMMKRGIHVDYLNFITPPHTDQKTVDKVNRIVKELIKYQGYAKVYRSNYTDLMNLIGLTSNQAYKINLMRRSFYRMASELATNKHYLGLSNGENLGQVASQTLESIATIASQATMPIYRPLLSADKIETINKAKKLGLYEISIEQANESCEIFAPKAPVTKPKEIEAQRLESELGQIKELEAENLANNIEEITFEID